MDDQLFEVEDIDRGRFVNKFVEPTVTPYERTKQIKKITHTSDPVTSLLAAAKVTKTISAKEQEVIEAHKMAWPQGLSDEKLAALLHVRSTTSGNNAAKRRSSLKNKGVIVDSGRKEKNTEGNLVVIWVLASPPQEGIENGN